MSAKSRSGIIAKVVRYMESHPGMTASLIRRNMSRHGALASDVAAAAEQRGYEFAPSPAPGQRSTPRPPAFNRSSAAKTPLGAVPVDAMIESQRLDAFAIVERALRNDLPADCTVEDEDLRRHCEISKEDWRDIRNDERLAEWRVVVRRTKKVIWCGRKARQKMETLDSISLV